MIGEEIEKVPLRHQGDELAVGGQVREVREGDRIVADHAADFAQLHMRQLQERLDQSEFVHDLKRGGVDCVAAKVAQEILVLFQHRDVNAGARQQKSEHHAGRTAACDHAARGDGFHGEVALQLIAARSHVTRSAAFR